MTDHSPLLAARESHSGATRPGAAGFRRHATSLPVSPSVALLAITLFWTIYGSIVALTLLDSTGWRRSLVLEILGISFGGAYLWAIITPTLLWLVASARVAGLRGSAEAIAFVACGLGLAALISTVVAGGDLLLDGQLGFRSVFRTRLPRDVLASYLVLTAGVALDYLETLRARQREAAELRAKLVQTRLDGLRAQLNPHFLFNTLNAVSALATVDPKRVQRIIAQLSDLLRYMLAGSTAAEITIEEECALLQRYFEILELRYGEWLSTRIEREPDTAMAMVPNLILQPLADNAVKHAIGLAGEGSIVVRACREGETLVLSVEDSGPGQLGGTARSEETVGFGGFGLRQAHERLVQLYGNEGSIRLIPTPAGGMVAEISIPFHTTPVLGDTDA
jgi:sensor histidine kinase YesM